jgi:hypothetical protein
MRMTAPGPNAKWHGVRYSVAIGVKQTTYAQCKFFAL